MRLISYIGILSVLLAVLFPLSGCKKSTESPKPVAESAKSSSVTTAQESVRLTTVSPGKELAEAAFSPDGKAAAVIVQHKDGRKAVVIKGAEGRTFDDVSQLIFAPDGHVIYEATLEERRIIVSNNKTSTPFDLSHGRPLLAISGNRIAYTEHHNSREKANIRICSTDITVCRNGQEYDYVNDLMKDSSGKVLLYVATRNSLMAVVTVDVGRSDKVIERVGAWYDEIQALSISESGKHTAFIGKRGSEVFLIRDGVEKAEPGADMPLFGAISNKGRFAFMFVIEDQASVRVDGKKIGGTYEEVGRLVFSPDGQHLAFAARKGNKWFLVVNGTEGPGFDIVVTPQFAPDSKSVVYRARSKGERFVVVSDLKGKTVREHPHYESVWQPVFLSEGKYLGYGVKSGQELWWKVEELN